MLSLFCTIGMQVESNFLESTCSKVIIWSSFRYQIEVFLLGFIMQVEMCVGNYGMSFRALPFLFPFVIALWF